MLKSVWENLFAEKDGPGGQAFVPAREPPGHLRSHVHVTLKRKGKTKSESRETEAPDGGI